MRLLPILFGFSGCPTDEGKSPETGEVCELLVAPCPPAGERAEFAACEMGHWGTVVQCEPNDDTSCVFADHEIVSVDSTLWVTCDDGYSELRGLLCGC